MLFKLISLLNDIFFEWIWEFIEVFSYLVFECVTSRDHDDEEEKAY